MTETWEQRLVAETHRMRVWALAAVKKGAVHWDPARGLGGGFVPKKAGRFDAGALVALCQLRIDGALVVPTEGGVVGLTVLGVRFHIDPHLRPEGAQ